MLGLALVAKPLCAWEQFKDDAKTGRLWIDPVVREGDPISLAIRRTVCYPGPIIMVESNPTIISPATRKALAELCTAAAREGLERHMRQATERGIFEAFGVPARMLRGEAASRDALRWLEGERAISKSRADEPGAVGAPDSVLPLDASTVALGVGHCPGVEGEHSLGAERPAG